MLRKGKAKTTLESSIDSALLAVEIYNKPRTAFRSEGFITMMIIAWTRLFHAYFHYTIGDKYFYKKKNGHYDLVDGERKSWDLSKCIKEYKNLNAPVQKNLNFFIKLRNKIEHRHIDKKEVDTLIFGECQSLLFNYETYLVKIFGNDYSVNEALVYSLQFSLMRTNEQKAASKSALSKDYADIIKFVNNYRGNLSDDVFNSQEFSIKLIQVPKVTNTNRSDLAIEYVKWDSTDKEVYEKISVLIKDKKVKVEGANVGKLKPGDVVKKVKNEFNDFKMHIHTNLYKIFSIRPNNGADDPFDTNNNFCHYDEAHKDYLYTDDWVIFLIDILINDKITIDEITKYIRQNVKLDINNFLN